ncbi:DUF6185 family protein [Streptomyces herbicida]|uniref:DUF6185 family protein n=1 Tax=Streptomyces herbicida TaxID=3065675 RepID=UPI00292F03CA|nr:DUF6185 family protein [Streptomyces sp. NEAU-HV9]
MGDCSAIGNSKEINANSQLVFKRHARFVEVRQVTCIEVPKSWKNAHDLALSADSPKCKEAMRRLLGGDSEQDFDAWNPEWRPPGSQVTEQKDRVMVRYESWNLISTPGDFQVGPWKVNVEPGQAWTVALHLPDALRRASWKDIRIDPGGLGISDALGDWETEKESGTRIWIGQGLNVKVGVVPPKSLALSDNARLRSLFIVSWWVCASAVIAVSAWPFLDRRKKGGNPEKAAVSVLAATVLQWAGLSAALGLALLLLLGIFRLDAWRPLIGILSGLTLVLLARPWLPLAQGSDNSHKGMKRRAVVVAVSAVAAVAAAISLLVIGTPDLFGLSPSLKPAARPPALGIAGLVVLDLSMLWMWLTAIAAWAWRFAREGRLGESMAGRGPEYPLRRMAAIGVALAVVAAAVIFFRYRTFEDRWHRADWLGEGRDLFGVDHLGVLSQQFTNFASSGTAWLYSYTWVLSGFALVALLHSSSRTNPESLGPQGWDLVLVTAVFAIVVPLRGAEFGGAFGSVYGLWLPLNMIVLYVVVKAGSRWSVLGRVGRKAGMKCIVAELSSPAGYQLLTEYAHRFRDLVRRLRVVDQGNTEDGTRRNLEKQLRSLHHWRPTGCSHDCLPDAVSVVDVALCWGPGRRWWNNALIGARWASVFGILPSMVIAWYRYVYGAQNWTFTFNSPTGIPDTVGKFLTQEIAFAGSGLVLGALWRVLPGEHGPMRAFSLFIAWLIAILVVAVHSVSENPRELGLEVLKVVLMLTVLTMTSMWMDTDTFSRERLYGTKRLGLLTSLYEVRGFSGQVAFLIAQLVAMVTIWQSITTRK